MIFFTADTHFGHANILRYAKRPWIKEGDLKENGDWVSRDIAQARAREMDEALIENWNKTVHKGDIVYHLGDFCMGSRAESCMRYIRRLNGALVFIRGNHDAALVDHFRNEDFDQVLPHVREASLGGRFIVMNHFAMRVWNKSHFNSWHIYGHSHGTLPGVGKSMDVGIDSVEANYCPISFPHLSSIMDKLPNNPNWLEKLPGYNSEEYESERRKEADPSVNRNNV